MFYVIVIRYQTPVFKLVFTTNDSDIAWSVARGIDRTLTYLEASEDLLTSVLTEEEYRERLTVYGQTEVSR
jgi:hypothetical protein